MKKIEARMKRIRNKIPALIPALIRPYILFIRVPLD